MWWQKLGICNTGGGGLTKVFYGDHVCDVVCDGPEGCLESRREKGRLERVKQAKRLCAMCPVTDECLDFAMRHKEKFGVWGGKTERERMRLRKEQRNNGNQDQG